MERYFHVVLKTDLDISFSTTPSVVIAKKLECEVISRYLHKSKQPLEKKHGLKRPKMN